MLAESDTPLSELRSHDDTLFVLDARGAISAMPKAGGELNGLVPHGSGAAHFGVTATSLGTKNNTTTAVTSVEGGAGNVASATLTVGVLAPIPTLSQWGVLMLGLLMMVVAGMMIRSRKLG